jgi:hypothetical protein
MEEDLMRTSIAASLLLSVLAGTGCGHRAVEISPKAQPVGNRWNATLATPAELSGAIQVTGTAWMAPNEKDPSTTRAHVTIANASPGGAHPWHVHRGQCGTDQGIVGPPDAYTPLKVGGNGEAEGDVVLAMPLPKEGSYFVAVHASAVNMNTILACGNLAPPAQ